MKKVSAQYVFTNKGTPLRKGVITAAEDGTILNVEDTGGNLEEGYATMFYNGIIVPGFVNCHCHLELSVLKGTIPEGKGLGDFIMMVRSTRDDAKENIIPSASEADDEMFGEGIVLCADICNSPVTFDIKVKSRITYINLLEVFGIDPGRTAKRMDEILRLSAGAESSGLTWSIVPHSAYSVSLPLYRLLKEKTKNNRVTSIHFMETGGEAQFLSDHSGQLRESYEASGLLPRQLQLPASHTDAILNEVTRSGNLILVHNTYADKQIIKALQTRKNLYWCLCPNSNMYIENRLPPVELLKSEGCEITIGTDSLASNRKLSMLEEMKTLQKHFPSITLKELIGWATINGSKALGKDEIFGIIEPGKKPGLLLLENTDLVNLRLLPETTVKRLL